LDAGNYFHLSLPGIPLFDINVIKSNSEIAKWKSDNFVHLEKLSAFSVERVSMKYPDLMSIYRDKIAESQKFDYQPIYDVNGHLDFAKTFEYERLFIYAGMQLKINEYEDYVCGCRKSFALDRYFQNHIKTCKIAIAKKQVQ
jgi:hypothetical protein